MGYTMKRLGIQCKILKTLLNGISLMPPVDSANVVYILPGSLHIGVNGQVKFIDHLSDMDQVITEVLHIMAIFL